MMTYQGRAAIIQGEVVLIGRVSPCNYRFRPMLPWRTALPQAVAFAWVFENELPQQPEQ